MYSERQDNIGEVARKISGKQHSLELNPSTLKYKINRDAQGKFLNLQFTSGEFVGLSVLGDGEKPAFTGSHFFTNNEEFDKFADTCHKNFDRFLTFLNENGGKIEVMEFSLNQFLEKVAEAAELTMQEFQRKIWQWLDNNGVMGYLVENTDDYAIIEVFEQGEHKCYKYQVEVAEEKVELHNPIEVKYTWTEVSNEQEVFAAKEPEEEEKEEKLIEPATDSELTPVKEEEEGDVEDPEDKSEESEEPEDAKAEEDKEPEPEPETEVEDKEVETTPETEVDDDEDEQSFADNSVVTAEEGVSNAAEIQEVQESLQTDKMGETTTSFSSSALSDSERLELEEFRRQAKIATINEYKGDVDESVLAQYTQDVDKYSAEQLLNELNRVFREQMKKQIQNSTNTIDNSKCVNAFQIISRGTNSNYNENNPADVIHKYQK